MERGPLYAKISPGYSLLCRKPAHGRLSGKTKRARKRVTFYELIDLASDDEQSVGDLSDIDVSIEEYDEDEEMDLGFDQDSLTGPLSGTAPVGFSFLFPSPLQCGPVRICILYVYLVLFC